MKIVVDKMPTKPNECLFVITDVIWGERNKCLLRRDEAPFRTIYDWCELRNGVVCPYLTETKGENDG